MTMRILTFNQCLVIMALASSPVSFGDNDLEGDMDGLGHCQTPGWFDEAPGCGAPSDGTSCLTGLSQGKLFEMASIMLTCRTSCLKEFMDKRSNMTSSAVELINMSGGLGPTLSDPFGFRHQVFDLGRGFTLTARQHWFNAQLNSALSRVFSKLSHRPYTRSGLKKRRIPKELFNKLIAFRERALENDNWVEGLSWCGQISSDNGESRYETVHSQRHYNITNELARETSEVILPEVERWASELSLSRGGPLVRLQAASEYGHEGTQGIRRYLPGSWLSAHIENTGDNLLGVLLNLGHASGMKREWPYHIYDYDGAHHMIKLQAGDMLMFEGCRLPHGRVESLREGWYDEIFVNYKPIH